MIIIIKNKKQQHNNNNNKTGLPQNRPGAQVAEAVPGLRGDAEIAAAAAARLAAKLAKEPLLARMESEPPSYDSDGGKEDRAASYGGR